MNTQTTLRQAQALINKGDAAGARRLINGLRDIADNAIALELLAISHAMSNDYPGAEKLFERALAITGDNPVLLNNLGQARAFQNKLDAAISAFEHSLSIAPDSYDALKNIAACLAHQQKFEHAYPHAEKAYRQRQDDPVVLNILARRARQLPDLVTAISLYRLSLRIHPEQPLIVTKLADTYCALKEYDSAESLLQQAISTQPHMIHYMMTLARFFQSRNRHRDAVEQYEQIISNEPDNTAAIAGNIASLIKLLRFQDAEQQLQQARHHYPDDPCIIAQYCSYLLLRGRYEEGYELASAQVAGYDGEDLVPDDLALVYSTLCQHTRRHEEAQWFLLPHLDDDRYDLAIQEQFRYHLGDICDKLERYDEAMEHYLRANDIVWRPTDIEYYESLFDDLIDTIDNELIQNFQGAGSEDSSPVFIVGMPRSGTTLVEQILSQHPDVYAAGEITDLWLIANDISGAMNLKQYSKNLAALKPSSVLAYAQRYLDRTDSLRSDEYYITDKLPHNFMHIGLINILFPNAHVIHCRRHPFDTCLSIYFKHFSDGHVYAKDLGELARFYHRYMQLMEHWQSNCSVQMLTLDYEAMVADPEQQSRNLLDFAELDWSDEIMRYHESGNIIMTPSYHQASRPIYTGSRYRWRHYRKHLQPLIDVLGDPESYIPAE